MPQDWTLERLPPDSPHLDTVTRWTHDTWGHLNPALDFADRLAETRDECGEAGVPSVFVAMSGETPLGTASLIVDDMSSRPELTPWLASVFVLPEWRGRGIASALVRRVECEAREAGLERFYLYTPDQQALYRRLGWRDVESVDYRGETVTIMVREWP
ncbi:MULTISPECIES: GNAT family N-acetyltransferase [Modicisalibacter]|uniref:GNAT family N-acetyltransferase n=1 Tax=Modicisalibacter TaxID=574347 RepID=UPI00100B5B87|nr:MULTISPECIES: GNAT family N-acetyltransferase [Halomonadaceae]MBZ9559612.1 GNAT family N-acetyltransferase [Modicisalibacter sp. R2A 31.J]MBZ9577064.1 GNAT family N-acetyltransferase [Modicisalibacter sp. MOD 31.J]